MPLGAVPSRSPSSPRGHGRDPARLTAPSAVRGAVQARGSGMMFEGPRPPGFHRPRLARAEMLPLLVPVVACHSLLYRPPKTPSLWLRGAWSAFVGVRCGASGPVLPSARHGRHEKPIHQEGAHRRQEAPSKGARGAPEADDRDRAILVRDESVRTV